MAQNLFRYLKIINEIVFRTIRLFFIFLLIIIFIFYRNTFYRDTIVSTLKEIFDYKTIYGEIIYAIKTNISKKVEAEVQVPTVNLVPSQDIKEEILDKNETTKTTSLSIPKINIASPLLFGESTSEQDIRQLLTKGVVAYPGSSLPGEKGLMIILGHSAPPGWPKIRYDWVFSQLNELTAGDEILISNTQNQYRYFVIKKFFLKPGEEIPIVSITGSNSIILLVSCWPPGRNLKRIVVQAELKD